MLVKEFLKLVVIANIIAIPIAYFLMNRMIQFIFSYPVKIGANIFIFTALITLIVAFFTVTSQALKAAQANPVESLKYE
jgi:putative ABC transport system permease protein